MSGTETAQQMHIAEWLRAMADQYGIASETADLIEQQQADIAKLRRALEPLADVLDAAEAAGHTQAYWSPSLTAKANACIFSWELGLARKALEATDHD